MYQLLLWMTACRTFRVWSLLTIKGLRIWNVVYLILSQAPVSCPGFSLASSFSCHSSHQKVSQKVLATAGTFTVSMCNMIGSRFNVQSRRPGSFPLFLWISGMKNSLPITHILSYRLLKRQHPVTTTVLCNIWLSSFGKDYSIHGNSCSSQSFDLSNLNF